MLNLKAALAADIEAGLRAAVAAGALARLETIPPVTVSVVPEAAWGDYASPVALALSQLTKKPPLEITALIIQHMPKAPYIGKLSVAPPGFLNISLSGPWLLARLDDVLEQELASALTVGQGKSVNLEFISANPTGPLTLANARTAFFADTLANVFERVKYNVTREYYVNDAGRQVARLGEAVLRRALQAQGIAVEFPEDLYQGDYVKELAAVIAEEWQENHGKTFTEVDVEDRTVREWVSTRAVELMLGTIKQTVAQDLKVDFDVWTSEKALRESGVIEQTLEKLRQQGLTYTQEGAEYIKTTQFGDDQDRVLKKRDGEYAYIAPDIAYHHGKYQRGFDLIFTFVGVDHQGHLPKLKAAMQALGNDVHKLHLVAAQWFRLVRDGVPVTVSKRAGMIVTPKDLIDAVGYDAARFFLLQHRLETHMDFDLNLAAEQSERNPVYYVQYAYVRLQSILRKAKEESDLVPGPLPAVGPAEAGLLKMLYRWPEVVAEAAENFMVHSLTRYATELARAVHVFYREAPVLGAPDEATRRGRLLLTQAAQKVLRETLELLGLSKPEVM